MRQASGAGGIHDSRLLRIHRGAASNRASTGRSCVLVNRVLNRPKFVLFHVRSWCWTLADPHNYEAAVEIVLGEADAKTGA